jgi:maltose/moltooligosaccharide transporter
MIPAPKLSESIAELSADSSKTAYEVGTLRYSLTGVLFLFVWLLLGDFCLYLMEAILPNVLPLQIKALGGSSSLLTDLLTVSPAVVALTLNPVISTWSDSYRSSWGRRIPFLIAGAPLIAFILMGLGWSDALGRALHRLNPGLFSLPGIQLVVISVLVVGFFSCNAVVYNLYFALFNDVVPREWMGRFAVMFRVVGTLGTASFNFFVFPYALTHMRLIYTGGGILYAVAYLVMCLKVRESQYPAPARKSGPGPGMLFAVGQYFRECFAEPFYIYYTLSGAFWTVTVAMTPFLLLMSLSLGLTTKDIGWIHGAAGVLSIPGFLISGVLMERYGALRLYFWMKVGQVIAVSGLTIFLFMDFSRTWVLIITSTFYVMLLCFNAVLIVVGIPINMALLPRERFAQFCSAIALVGGVFGIVGGVTAGFFMDAMMKMCTDQDWAYRFAPAWQTVFTALSMICFYKVYRYITDTHGHDLKSFVPPLSPLSNRHT